MAKLKKIRRKMMWPIEAFAAYAMLYSIKIFTFRGARRVGAFLGSIVYMIPSQKKLVMTNLKLAFPEKDDAELKKIGKKSVQGLALSFIEFIWFYKSIKKMQKYIHVPDEVKEHYFSSKDSERPIIFLAMHMGNWELAPYGFKKVENIDGCVIARRFKNPFLEKLINGGRECGGIKVLHEKGAARGIVKALRDKISVGMLVDQNTKTHQGGVYTRYFGLPVTISKMPAKMATRMKSQILLLNCLRTKDGFELYLDHLPKKVEEYETDDELNQAMMDMMEKAVRNTPEQWVWLYKRWNYIPKNWGDKKGDFPSYAVMDERLDFNG